MTTLVLAALLAVQDSEVLIPFEKIPKEGMSTQGPACEKVVRDAKAWKEFWTLYTSNRIPPPALPKIDFASEAVVAVVDLHRPSSGYAIQITKIVRTRDAVVVSVLRTSPPKGKGQTAAGEEPACVVRAKLPADLPVRFVEEKP